MTTDARKTPCVQGDLVALYALQALSADDVPPMETHLARCAECRRDLDTLLPMVDAFADWPTDVLRPSASLWDRLIRRVTDEAGQERTPIAGPSCRGSPWEDVAAGISCKMLATGTARSRVSMLVRLAPGAEYPPHRHADIEDLYLLSGELWINDRKLYPGDYNRALAGTSDHRVWSETGCTCVLNTSTRDVLL